jgi:GNAT superfamily N-acetyltransferase
MLEAAASWARSHGQRQLYLWVYAGNRRARSFYEHLGWRERQRCLEEVPGGGKRVALRMVKAL